MRIPLLQFLAGAGKYNRHASVVVVAGIETAHFVSRHRQHHF